MVSVKCSLVSLASCRDDNNEVIVLYCPFRSGRASSFSGIALFTKFTVGNGPTHELVDHLQVFDLPE